MYILQLIIIVFQCKLCSVQLTAIHHAKMADDVSLLDTALALVDSQAHYVKEVLTQHSIMMYLLSLCTRYMVAIASLHLAA